MLQRFQVPRASLEASGPSLIWFFQIPPIFPSILFFAGCRVAYTGPGLLEVLANAVQRAVHRRDMPDAAWGFESLILGSFVLDVWGTESGEKNDHFSHHLLIKFDDVDLFMLESWSLSSFAQVASGYQLRSTLRTRPIGPQLGLPQESWFWELWRLWHFQECWALQAIGTWDSRWQSWIKHDQAIEMQYPKRNR